MKQRGADSDGNFFHEKSNVDDSVVLGRNNYFGPNVHVAAGCTFGHGNLLLENVVVGPECTFKSRAELRSGTLLGKGVYVDSGVKTSGDCQIQAHASLRYDCIIARGCMIGEHAYISPQVMTNNLTPALEPVGGANVGEHCFIGTQTVLGAGIEIAPGTVIGSCSNVTKSIEKRGIYFGNPAQFFKEHMGLTEWLKRAAEEKADDGLIRTGPDAPPATSTAPDED